MEIVLAGISPSELGQACVSTGVGLGRWAGRGARCRGRKQAGEQEAGCFAGETPGLHCPQLSLGPSCTQPVAFFPYPVSGEATLQ